MNKSLKVGRLGARYCWRIGSLHPHSGHVSGLRGLQRRHYADRYTFDDLTQARIDAANRKPISVPRENPWRDSQWSPDFPKRLDEIGYESHCNDRLYIAKNKQRHTQQEYDQQRLQRRLEAQQRVQDHFERGETSPENRRRFVMQDPSEHQKRQEQIIALNRRRWLSRPEAKREINTSGITYRPEIQKEAMDLVEAQKRSQVLDSQRGLMRSRERSEGERQAEGEDEQRQAWRAEDYRMRSQSLDSGLQRRLNRLMKSEGETNPGAEEEDYRVRSQGAEGETKEEDYRVRSQRDQEWRVKRPRWEAEDEQWQLQSRKPEGESEDWPVSRQPQDYGLQKRLARLMERAAAEANPEGEDKDWRVRSQSAEGEADPEGEDKGWRVRSQSAEGEADPEGEDKGWRVRGQREEDYRVRGQREEDYRVRGQREEDYRVKGQKEEDWRTKSRKAEAEDEHWRLQSRRPEGEEEDWRVRSPRADAGIEDWRIRGQREEDWRVRSQSLDSGLQTRLKQLMERSEGETQPDAEMDWREKDPRAEGEESPRAEGETKGDAEDDWKARDLSLVYDPNRPTKAWLKRREAEQEAQYWHTWHTCPATREGETSVEVKPHIRRKKVVVHPPSYARDGQRRGYHQLVPPTDRLKATTLMLLRKRRPSGIVQQYHKFARQTAFYPEPLEAQPQPQPLSDAEQMPRPIRVFPRKEKKGKPKRKGERQPVVPPRFKMTIKSRPAVARKPTPVASYSRRLRIPPEVAGPNFYMANLRSSVSETWRAFAESYAE